MSPPKGPGPHVLVTGASGFLGRHLVEHLAHHLGGGGAVRALVRRPALHLDRLGVQTVLGDVTDPRSCRRALEGVTQVYHLAGRVSRRARDASAMYHLHVEGTRVLLDEALHAGVQRVLLVSSSGTSAVDSDPRAIATEATPYRPERVARWPYYLSKIYQEQLARDFAERTGLDIVILAPSLLLGPGDVRGSSTKDVERIVRGQMAIIPGGGGVSFVDARDVATTCVAAMERAERGSRYLLGAVNMPLETFVGRIARLAGRAAPRPWLPGGGLARIARALDAVLETFDRDLPIEPETLEMAAATWYLDASKAKRELGFAPRDPQETLAETVRDVERRIHMRGP